MELGLSLGSEASKPIMLIGKPREVITKEGSLGFCMGTSISPNNSGDKKHEEPQESSQEEEEEEEVQGKERPNNKEMHSQDQASDSSQHEAKSACDLLKEMVHHKSSPIQLDLLPNTPVLRSFHHNSLLTCPTLTGNSEVGCSIKLANIGRGLDVKRVPPKVVVDLDLTDRRHQLGEEAVAADQDESSSPQNSGASSFLMDFSLFNNKFGRNIKEADHDINHRQRRASSRVSDEDENGCTRKKLRLSKEQSAFLEESFKEHSTLNPKQKLALAKQLNLQPRQVEVWFQNRRARTKLKQTEVDCEYLKRCCETLTEENRRLHKEIQELKALTTSNPFYKQLPATTLTMCPSCERIATTTNTNNNNNNKDNNIVSDPISKPTELQLTRPRFFPFSQT